MLHSRSFSYMLASTAAERVSSSALEYFSTIDAGLRAPGSDAAPYRSETMHASDTTPVSSSFSSKSATSAPPSSAPSHAAVMSSLHFGYCSRSSASRAAADDVPAEDAGAGPVVVVVTVMVFVVVPSALVTVVVVVVVVVGMAEASVERSGALRQRACSQEGAGEMRAWMELRSRRSEPQPQPS